MSQSSFIARCKSLIVGAENKAHRARNHKKHSRIAQYQVECLEPRTLMTGTPIPVTFTIPSDVATQGVWVSMYATLTADYTNSANTDIPNGTVVYYDGTLGDYEAATAQSPLTFQLSGNGAVVNLPNTNVTAGELFIGVRSAPSVSYNGSGINPATPANSSSQYYALTEYSVAAAGLDLDFSEEDQTGVPITISTTPQADFPAQYGVGIQVPFGDLMNLYTPYISSLVAAGSPAANFQQLQTLGNGYRIYSPQSLFIGQTEPLATGPTYLSGGSLTEGQNYYYFVTATSSTGETGPSNPIWAVPYFDSGPNLNMQTVVVSWSSIVGASGYNVYRNTQNDASSAQFVGSAGASATSFTDYGTSNYPTQNPPANSYTFNPLGTYFNTAIDNFFSQYDPAGANQTFSINMDGHLFTGQTNDSYSTDGNNYTALVLNSSGFPGEDYVIFEPYFSNNTNIANAPPAPSWMQNANQSPGWMIFGQDGVFNTGGQQPGADAGVLSDLENAISSAFNRGIADTFSILPDNWAYHPGLTGASVSQAPSGEGFSAVKAGTYYYVITATTQYGEATISNEVVATVAAGQEVTLTWDQHNEPTQYNIYRSTTSGSGYKLIGVQTNAITPPATSWVDEGGPDFMPPHTPPTYYATGTASNWYASFLHQNYTTNSTSGVSINGLAYAFPYDDQGNQSTNMLGDFTAVSITLSGMGTSQSQASSIKLIKQPLAGRVGSNNVVTFQLLNAQGGIFYGGADVKVDVIGMQKGSYTVKTDARTGIGSLTFKNKTLGFSMLKLRLDSGESYNSNVFQVVPKRISARLLSIFDREDDRLSTKAFEKILQQLARRRR